jgi:hypothetical protein
VEAYIKRKETVISAKLGKQLAQMRSIFRCCGRRRKECHVSVSESKQSKRGRPAGFPKTTEKPRKSEISKDREGGKHISAASSAVVENPHQSTSQDILGE